MGTLIGAECYCGYSKELLEGCGMSGPESCRRIAVCDKCDHPMSLNITTKEPRCSHCHSRRLRSLELDEDVLPITGLICPSCNQPTLRMEEVGLWD